MTAFNVIGFRGWIGSVYSLGVDEAVEAIKASAHWQTGNYAIVTSYDTWQQFIPKMERWQDPTIFIGHSFGPSSVLQLARRITKTIPLLCSIDPSPWYSWQVGRIGPGPVPQNVAKVMNWYQKNSWFIPGQPLYREDGSARDITNIRISASHTNIDENSLVQKGIKDAVSAWASLNPPQPVAA